MRIAPLIALLFAACAHDEAAPEAVTVPVTTVPASPRRVEATRGSARVSLEDGPGFLIDGNAPPPAPGQPPLRHPAFHGRCIGDPVACSAAGDVVRSATSLEEVVPALEALGFTVTVER